MGSSLDGQKPGWLGHVRRKVAVTPSDTTAYDPPLRLLYVLGAGDVTFVLDDDTVTVTRTLAAKTTGIEGFT